ncbi:MAG: glycosyltransferase family 1 protein [Dehalococcoidia bacterium]|nr:MAG: glycosyltransferase family 1 protein [Dehalococcoidia bacterium]
MRIALVHHTTYQFHGLSDLVPSLAKRGHEIVEISWSGSKELLIDKVSKRYTRYLLPGINFSSKRIVGVYPFLPSLSKIIKTVRPDIVHAQSHLFLTTYSAINQAFRCKIPSIITVHGMLAKRTLPINLVQQIYLYTMSSSGFKKATKIICLTRSDANEVIKYNCKPEKVRIVPNGVNTEVFKPSSFEEKKNLIGWIGRFVPEKGLKYLVDALNIMAGQNRKSKFILIGDGPQMSKVIRMVNRYGLSDRTFFTGQLPHKKIHEIMSKASIFVLPSIKEGMPITLLEIMASGKPVVASDISGINDVLTHGKNGLLVPPCNAERLAEAVLMLMNDQKLRKSLGENARQLMVEKYNWDLVAEKIEEIYLEAIEDSN